MRVFTGDKVGAGTDANVLIAMTGEFGDSGERELSDSGNINKFEKNQEDVFSVTAVELGRLKKLRIRHDNKGGGAAWYLDRVEVEDPKNNKTCVLYFIYDHFFLVNLFKDCLFHKRIFYRDILYGEIHIFHLFDFD